MVARGEAVARPTALLAVTARIVPDDRLIPAHIAIADTAAINPALRITLFPVRCIIIVSPDQKPEFVGSGNVTV
jgi:hypothetical protein